MEQREVSADGATLSVGVCGAGPDVLVLSGGPGNVNYLAEDHLAPIGMRAWFPDPRGVGGSTGGPHPMAQAVLDLEAVRSAAGVDAWVVLGHSWGSDLAVRYALDHPEAVTAVVGVAGHGLHQDRSWSAIYEQGRLTEPVIDIALDREVWKALQASFLEWIHEPGLFRGLADTTVPMSFIAAGGDIRPHWPLRQLAHLVPHGRFDVVDDVPHDFWSTHPAAWRQVVSQACARFHESTLRGS